MEIKQLNNGRWVQASYHATKKRFRSTLTKDFLPVESTDLNQLPKVRTYKSPESVMRAVRKFKAKL